MSAAGRPGRQGDCSLLSGELLSAHISEMISEDYKGWAQNEALGQKGDTGCTLRRHQK